MSDKLYSLFVPARNDIIPKYSVHDKKNIDIMICRILYPFFNDIMYFGSSSSNILDFFFSSIYLIFPSKNISSKSHMDTSLFCTFSPPDYTHTIHGWKHVICNTRNYLCYRIYSISSHSCFFDTLHSIRTNDGIAPNNKSIPKNDN